MLENYKLTIMKELSIEEKAKRYELALERCRKLYNEAKANEYISDIEDYETIFPELTENNNDEKIRKVLVKYFKSYKEVGTCGAETFNGIPTNDVINWLEKQVPVDEDEIVKGIRRGVAISLMNHIDANSKGMCLSNMECEDIENAIVNEDWDKVYGYMKKKLEKQGEPNHCMIQWKGDNLKEVIDFTGKDKNFEKWFKSFEEYEKYVQEHDGIFKLFNADGSHYEVPVGAWIVKTPDGYNVASKAVFKQKSVDTPKFKVEQTSTWSEDDKDLMYNTLSNLTELKDRYGEGYGKVGKCIDWLKSLKERVQPQNTWKPSGEQILALRWILNNIPYNRHKEEISGLLEQLKKLREE